MLATLPDRLAQRFFVQAIGFPQPALKQVPGVGPFMVAFGNRHQQADFGLIRGLRKHNVTERVDEAAFPFAEQRIDPAFGPEPLFPGESMAQEGHGTIF